MIVQLMPAPALGAASVPASRGAVVVSISAGAARSAFGTRRLAKGTHTGWPSSRGSGWWGERCSQYLRGRTFLALLMVLASLVGVTVASFPARTATVELPALLWQVLG